jgi:hypothetical protein
MPKKSSVEENVLYVVIHGLVTLIDVKEKGFLAHMLEIGDEHEYLLGDWLEEAAIPERKTGKEPLRATLTQVDSGPAQLDPGQNAVLKLNSVPADTSSNVRAVLRLPRPRKIYNFVRGKLRANALNGDLSRLVRTPNEISGVAVFEYTFQDKERVALVTDSGTGIWKPKGLAFVSVPGGDLAVAVLHVYDEPGIRLRGDAIEDMAGHNRREFKLSSEFLASNLELVKDTETPFLLLKDDVPPGLLPGEVTNLDERDQSVFAIVLGLRQGNASGAAAGGGSAGPICAGMHAQLM